MAVRRTLLRAHVVHRNAEGESIWEDRISNLLHDEGEIYILANSFDTDHASAGVPASLYVGLDNRGTIAEADALTDLSGEPSTGSYARQAVSTTTGFTLAQASTYYAATAAAVSFAPSGANYTAVQNAFLCTVVSGTSGLLICSLALSQSRTLLDGEQLDVTFVLDARETSE